MILNPSATRDISAIVDRYLTLAAATGATYESGPSDTRCIELGYMLRNVDDPDELPRPRIVTVTGPSLGGKSTFVNALVATGKFMELISTTTRLPRAGEVDGTNYYFVDEIAFLATPMIESVAFAGFRYGLTVAEMARVQAVGKIPVVVVEPGGAESIASYARDNGLDHTKIFVATNLRTRLGRFVDRFANETAPKMVAATYKNRLQVMLTEEAGWEDSQTWDVLVSQYEQGTEAVALRDVLFVLGLDGTPQAQSGNA